MTRERELRPTPDDGPGENEDSSATKPTDASTTIYLHPGRLHVCTEPSSIMTILGSCVAVCMWDPASLRGGMTHFVLPMGTGQGVAALRFGNVAVELLHKRLLQLDCAPERIRAKIFGGAAVLAKFPGSHGDLGGRNIEVARHAVRELGIPTPVEDVGGQKGRKVIFHTHTGDAWVKAI